MCAYDWILFDLDGTLTDPAQGITNSIAYALWKMGRAVPDRKELTRFIGPPLLETFRMDFGFSEDEAGTALRYFRAYFSEKGIYENRIYEGIGELLGALKMSGKMLAVATSKPEPFAVRILEHFGIADYFSCVAGSRIDETRTEKADVIRYALEKAGKFADRTAVMVGDRMYDILGARAAGIASVGVLYGFGTREELAAAGAPFLAADIEEVAGLLMPDTGGNSCRPAGPRASVGLKNCGNRHFKS